MKGYDKKVRFGGILWTPNDENTLIAKVGGDAYVVVWPFAGVHQCKLFLRDNDHGVQICLYHSTTRDRAVAKGLRWLERYRKQGPPSPARFFRACFVNYKTLYRTRADILDAIFLREFHSDYAWLHGAIVNTSPASHLGREDRRKANRGNYDHLPPDQRRRMQKMNDEIEAEIAALPIGPVADDGCPRPFSKVSNGRSNITLVPADVRPEWLALAYEAATMLRDMSGPRPETIIKDLPTSGGPDDALTSFHRRVHAGFRKSAAETRRREEKEQAANRAIDAKLCVELEKRFPTLARRPADQNFRSL